MRVCAANHHVLLRVHVAKLGLQFAQHLRQEESQLTSRDNDRILRRSSRSHEERAMHLSTHILNEQYLRFSRYKSYDGKFKI